ncbi:MAG: hypothetical protein RLP15_08310 [Cryomorphaceae bacterium]
METLKPILIGFLTEYYIPISIYLLTSFVLIVYLVLRRNSKHDKARRLAKSSINLWLYKREDEYEKDDQYSVLVEENETLKTKLDHSKKQVRNISFFFIVTVLAMIIVSWFNNSIRVTKKGDKSALVNDEENS